MSAVGFTINIQQNNILCVDSSMENDMGMTVFAQ